MPPLLAPASLLGSLLLLSCAKDPSSRPSAAERQALEVGTVNYTDDAVGFRFPMPESGVGVKAEHWDDPTLEVYKFRHEYTLTAESGAPLLIDVWVNPAHVALQPWFEENLQFLVEPGVAVWEETLTRTRVPGLMLEVPQSPQAPSMALAVFGHGDFIYRVTCVGYREAPDARQLFFQVVDGLELTRAR